MAARNAAVEPKEKSSSNCAAAAAAAADAAAELTELAEPVSMLLVLVRITLPLGFADACAAA